MERQKKIDELLTIKDSQGNLTTDKRGVKCPVCRYRGESSVYCLDNHNLGLYVDL